jgi:hypothetical protein
MKRRLDGAQREVFRLTVGACPSCAVFDPGWEYGRTVIYRRSNRSVTMRCEVCGLQWTMTFAKIHQAVNRQLRRESVREHPRTAALYEDMAAMTANAPQNETRGRKPAETARRSPHAVAAAGGPATSEEADAAGSA